MIEGFGGAVFTVVALLIVLLLFGAVLLVVIRSWLVDQTLETHEAAGVIGLFFLILMATITLWHSPAKVLPGLAGAVLFVVWKARLALRDTQAEDHYLTSQEAKARAMLERDPTALVAYERLAEVLLKQGRKSEALGVFRDWRPRDPNNRYLNTRIAELELQLTGQATQQAPAPAPFDPMLERRVAEPEPEPAPAPPFDFGPEPECLATGPEPAAELVPGLESIDFGPPAEDLDGGSAAPTETVTAVLQVGGEQPEDFAPGSRAFDVQPLAFDPDEDEPPDDGFASDPAAHTRT